MWSYRIEYLPLSIFDVQFSPSEPESVIEESLKTAVGAGIGLNCGPADIAAPEDMAKLEHTCNLLMRKAYEGIIWLYFCLKNSHFAL